MRSLFALLRAGLCCALLQACGSDPCAGQSGACLTLRVTGHVEHVDELRVDLDGAVKYRFATSFPAGHGLPASVAILLPDTATGELDVHVATFVANAVSAGGTKSVTIHANEHVHVTVAVQDLTAASCTDGVTDGDETDVDCGGSCSPCPSGDVCALATDCASMLCESQKCLPLSCADGKQDDDETDVDCGGSCATCADGKRCTMNTDCLSKLCTGGVCQSGSCTDGIKNDAETDVDCGGGVCPACQDGHDCAKSTDCSSGMCGSDGKCLASGGTPCTSDAECASGSCANGVCLAPILISAITPASSPSLAQTAIHISGVGFVAGASLAVSFDGKAGTAVTFVSATDVSVTTPSRAGCTAKPSVVVLTNGDARQVTDQTHFTFSCSRLEFAGGDTFTTPTTNGGKLGVLGQDVGAPLIADFNEDGLPDVLFVEVDQQGTNPTTYTARLALNRGGTVISTPVTLAVAGPVLVAALVDSDAHIDVVSTLDGTSVSVARGHGDGTFAAATTTATGLTEGYWGSQLIAAKIDSDAHMDLLVASTQLDPTASATVLLGDGTGAFPTKKPIGTKLYLAGLGDFDRDGKLDLASTGSSKASVQLGVGDGTFGTAVTTSLVGTTSGLDLLTVVDEDGDGAVDVVVVENQDQSFHVLLNNEHGAIEADARSLPLGPFIGLYDANADHKLDALLVDGGLAVEDAVAGGLLGGTITKLDPAPFYPGVVSFADFDGDGVVDLLGNIANNKHGVTLLPSAFLPAAAPTYLAAITSPSASSPPLHVADIDGNGHDDVVLADAKQVYTLLSAGHNLVMQTAVAVAGVQAFTLDTIDADKNIDMVAVANGKALLYKGAGDGTFAIGAAVSTASNLTSVSSADLNADHHVDLVLVGETVQILLQTANTEFTPGQSITGTGPVSLGDVNADQTLDLIVQGAAGPQLLLGKGDGTFLAPTTFALRGQLFFGDVDGDGRADVCSTTACQLGQAGGTLAAPVAILPTLTGTAVDFRDLDFDGTSEMLTLANNAAQLQMKKYGSPRALFASNYAVVAAAYGDFDGDTLVDVVELLGDGSVLVNWNRSF